MAVSTIQAISQTLRPELVRYASRLVGDTDADDVVQLVLSKASDAFSEFRGDASPRTWLYRITTNTAHDWNRARKRLEHEVNGVDDDDEELGFDDALQERSLLRNEMSRCVDAVLRRLPEAYRVVLALSDCEELSDREITEILGTSLGAVKVRLHRARVKMKAALEAECDFYRDTDNVLCCDRKEKSNGEVYPSDAGERLQGKSRESAAPSQPQDKELTMSANGSLQFKQKHLIGVGAAIAAGCAPCTQSYAKAARDAGACERGLRFAIEGGLAARAAATTSMNAFADATFARPELDASFREERVLLGSLIAVASAIASNTAAEVRVSIDAARKLGATDEQLRVAAQIGRTAKRGAERETDAAFATLLGDTVEEAGCCSDKKEETGCCSQQRCSSVSE